ncbi:hypothetical protein G6F59_015215 [Rhizopus arrhizus]|nr:hypothetical protein G6F59_015215 [Rhizopus arrhizus]
MSPLGIARHLERLGGLQVDRAVAEDLATQQEPAIATRNRRHRGRQVEAVGLRHAVPVVDRGRGGQGQLATEGDAPEARVRSGHHQAVARRAVGADGRVVTDHAAVERVVLVDVTVVAGGGPGVGDRGAPTAFLGERLLRRQQDLGGAGLDALLADDQAAEARHVAAPGLAQARLG